MLVLLVGENAQAQSDDSELDRLVYFVTNSGGRSYIVYDPESHVRTSLPIDTIDFHFVLSRDGRLAFASWQNGDAELYILDIGSADTSPDSLSPQYVLDGFPLSWSPDGRYLAYTASDRLYVWDGETIVDITPEGLDDNVQWADLSWNSDGRLAFTAWYYVVYPHEGDTHEVYLWDGNTTTSLRQNPAGEDQAPSWSADGRLAFLSEWNDEYDIFVWDGVSVNNGAPDKESFANIAPEFTFYYSFPGWSPDGELVFIGTSPQDEGHAQIYLWDGQTATNISQNLPLHSGSPTWSADGRWAFTTFFSPEQLVYVRDADNHTLLKTEGIYSPAWSSGGILMFCRPDRPDWILSMWDGQQIAELARGTEIVAQWESGSGVFCSSG
jgi:Tol biopolymer transport system component